MNVLGVCAGNGVIIHPFKEYLIGNVEMRAIFHSKKDEQWRANFNDIPLYKNIDSLRKGMKSQVDIIIGNPDCGHSSIFSLSRRKSYSDPRDNESLNLYIKCVKKYKPKVFLMENLPKLLETCDVLFWQKALPDYSMNYIVMPVSAWGNSQVTRVRLVIIGIRTDYALKYQNLQYQITRLYKLYDLKTEKELLKGLDNEDISLGHIREDINSIITLYSGFKISLKDVQEIWQKNPSRSRWVVKGRNFSTAPGVYRNLENKSPATARKANRQFNSKGLQMSPRELARIQGVPDDFTIFMDKSNLTYWINKGRATVTKTPPYEVGLWFYKNVIASWK